MKGPNAPPPPSAPIAHCAWQLQKLMFPIIADHYDLAIQSCLIYYTSQNQLKNWPDRSWSCWIDMKWATIVYILIAVSTIRLKSWEVTLYLTVRSPPPSIFCACSFVAALLVQAVGCLLRSSQLVQGSQLQLLSPGMLGGCDSKCAATFKNGCLSAFPLSWNAFTACLPTLPDHS